MTETALAAAATLVATAFALSTWERWLAHRRRHELAWSVALTLFAMASAALWVGASFGWDAVSFRAFYLLGAVLNVPVLALGTVYLLARRRTADVVAAAVVVAAAFAAGVVAAAPLTGPIEAGELPRGSEVFGPLPRILAAVASGGGAVVVFGGAVWSAARRRRTEAGAVTPGRLAAGNLILAAGVAILSVSGLLNSVLGEMQAFSLTLALGVAVLFTGFLVATTPGRGSPGPAPPAEDERITAASGGAASLRARAGARQRT